MGLVTTNGKTKLVPRIDHFDQKGLVNRLGRCSICCDVVDFHKRVRNGQYYTCKSCSEMTASLEIAHV